MNASPPLALQIEGFVTRCIFSDRRMSINVDVANEHEQNENDESREQIDSEII